ncbi:MAG: pantetheine-phosphate adenylyltransferase [Candidatus Omnitrophica bacterium]|nr:pantetheine-phosphate adenylyltransferase [Candidatus Omnitrophota bacterium]
MKEIAVYPGTFDPVTFGHIDVIRRAAALYNKVIVAVADSRHKTPLFTVQERKEMLLTSLCGMGLDNVKVESFTGLVVDYAVRKNAKVIIRGIRMISDFEYEFQMALTNRKINPDIETMFMMPNESYSYLSSRLIKEVSFLGADVSSFVPEHVQKILERKFNYEQNSSLKRNRKKR